MMNYVSKDKGIKKANVLFLESKTAEVLGDREI